MWIVRCKSNAAFVYLCVQVDQGGITLPDRDYYLNKSISDDKVRVNLKTRRNFWWSKIGPTLARCQSHTAKVLHWIWNLDSQASFTFCRVLKISLEIRWLWSFANSEEQRMPCGLQFKHHILGCICYLLRLTFSQLFFVVLWQVLSAYLEYMTEVGVLLGGERNATEDQMREVIEFEMKLAQVSVSWKQLHWWRVWTHIRKVEGWKPPCLRCMSNPGL